MVNANIDIFEMSYKESVSYFKRLENLEKIRRTNGPNPSSLPVDNKKIVSVTSSVGKSSKGKDISWECHKVVDYCKEKGDVNSSNHKCLLEWNDVNKNKSWVNYDIF
jgi:hypothetical protein